LNTDLRGVALECGIGENKKNQDLFPTSDLEGPDQLVKWWCDGKDEQEPIEGKESCHTDSVPFQMPLQLELLNRHLSL